MASWPRPGGEGKSKKEKRTSGAIGKREWVALGRRREGLPSPTLIRKEGYDCDMGEEHTS